MKYFAYGSNMSAERMRERGINFSERCFAMLEHFRLAFNKIASADPKMGYANIVRHARGIVEGVLYEIPDADIEELDNWEGTPDHYQKMNVTVIDEIGQEIEAVTYIANPDKTRPGLKPSAEYMQHLFSAGDMLTNPYLRNLRRKATLR